jgi:nucleoid-associated protein YgaU
MSDEDEPDTPRNVRRFKNPTPSAESRWQSIVKSLFGAGRRCGGHMSDNELQRCVAQLQSRAASAFAVAILKARQISSERNLEEVVVWWAKLEGFETPDRTGRQIKALREEAVSIVSKILTDLCARLEEEFRRVPSVENLSLYWEARFRCEDCQAQVPPLSVKLPPWPPGATTHLVVPGDTLSQIAKRYYGSENLWDHIFYDDRNEFPETPDLIRPGMVIYLPQSIADISLLSD